ncbi:hypothetical protein PG985_012908, partial [Apiospora marii]|uniref:uncharacterized protein n=1 Tax=Apiospora marii TaxID=335849 RepID=UPI00312E03AE
SCTTDLQAARAKIADACTASSDVIVYSNTVYPATFIADQYLFTSKTSCFKDRVTGDYCDPQFLLWSNESILTRNQSCSDCWLGVQAFELGNPFGYDEGMASDFAALTASCSASGYTYSIPPAYGTSATTTSPDTPRFTRPPTCTGSYTPQLGENCSSVAKAMSVSTYSMLFANGLDIHCQNFDTAINTSTSLCTPPTCKTYTWGPFDTCTGVASQHGIKLVHFLSWNPNFDPLCRNAINFVKYQVQTGDTCGKLSIAYSLPLSDFLFLNPEVYSNCTNLLLGVAYCVFPVGSIATYSGYKPAPTMPITVPPVTFPFVNTENPSPTSHPNPGFTWHQLPMASGTFEGCASCADYDDTTTDASTNSCSFIAYLYWVEVSDLIVWNPSLSKNETECALQPGHSYCVQKTDISAYVPSGNQCLEVSGANIPEGTDPHCACFTEVSGYDGFRGLDCESLAEDASIKLSLLTSWNPWLGSNCDEALFANLGDNDWRAVCIGVNSTAPTTTATIPPPTSVGTKSSGSMGPTPTGIAPGCQQFYTTQSGDSCAAIQGLFAISFADFYSWNPSSKYQSLRLAVVATDREPQKLTGYAYCVSAPSSTTSGGGNGPAAPTQSGAAPNCNKYYTVQSGDGCEKIESQFGITLKELYQWNPAIGSDCTNLWLGYAICVGVSSLR